MALVESYMLPLGTKSPKFSLLNVLNNQNETLDELKGEKGTLIIFMCNHCPYVVHLLNSIIDTAKDFSKKEYQQLQYQAIVLSLTQKTDLRK